MRTVFNWLLLVSESPFSRITEIWGSVLVDQLDGKVIYSVESNLIISDGFTVKRYFQTYPSPLSPALVGSKSVKFGSSCDELPAGFDGVAPFSIQM